MAGKQPPKSGKKKPKIRTKFKEPSKVWFFRNLGKLTVQVNEQIYKVAKSEALTHKEKAGFLKTLGDYMKKLQVETFLRYYKAMGMDLEKERYFKQEKDKHGKEIVPAGNRQAKEQARLMGEAMAARRIVNAMLGKTKTTDFQ